MRTGVYVGKPLAPQTFAVYDGNILMRIIYASSWSPAQQWARNVYGETADVRENVQALDITYEGY